MATSPIPSGSSFASGTFVSSDVPSLSLPAPSLTPTPQVIPGTTVVGTGSTGDVWSYTIPAVTTVPGPSPTPAPAPTSNPALTTAPAPASTLVLSTILVSGTIVTGGAETGVPWSYTIPDTTVVSSVYVSIAAAPSNTSLPPSSLTSSGSSTPSSTLIPPAPPPQSSQSSDVATLSGGIVAAVLGALFLLILAVAGFLCFRLRRQRRRVGTEWDRVKGNGVGAVWGRGWGSEDQGIGAWRQVRPGLGKNGSGGSTTGGGGQGGPGGVATGAPATGFLGGPVSGAAQDARPRNGGAEERGPPLLPLHAKPETTANTAYPASALYPQHRPHTDTHTRTTTSHTNTNANNDTTTLSSVPPPKQKRVIPPPSPYVYAPPPSESPDPSSIPTSYSRPTSPPWAHRTASPYGSASINPHTPKRLSKQRITPTASALLRHMVPTRGMSLRRPKSGHAAPTPGSTSASGTATPSSVRPNISTLPSFIRERQFSPSHPSNHALSSPSESALFSPSPRPAQLPPHSPLLAHPRLARSAPNLLPHPPPLAHARFAQSRDGLLSPPPYGPGPRDRYSQVTTRSGATGRSRDSRMTGRSGDTRMTGRSGDTRMTGRSGDSRFTGRSGGLAQILEGEREQVATAAPPRKLPPRRRREL